MNRTLKAIQLGKQLRVIGFDDAPFEKQRGTPVNLAGVVCSDTRFEGMLWGEVEKDGLDSTQQLNQMISQSKFNDQLHAVLLDGLAFGGFNIVNLPLLADTLQIPCIAVMRKAPDLDAIHSALSNFDDSENRIRLLQSAGPVQECNGFVFQCMGMDPDPAATLLQRVTDTGNVPEPLRLAHLIGAAVKTGQSGNRA